MLKVDLYLISFILMQSMTKNFGVRSLEITSLYLVTLTLTRHFLNTFSSAQSSNHVYVNITA